MCEITDLNFYEKYDQVIQDAKTCSFIALDCEFTGLGGQKNTISMFDDAEARYENMRSAISNLLVTQLGLSMYEYDKGQTYQTATYVFYLFPRSYPYSPESFNCDSRSLQFLALQNYDFNKTFKHGLTYIRISEEREMTKDIKNGKMVERLKKDLTIEDKRILEDISTAVYDWLYQSRSHGHTTVDLSELDPIRRFMVRERLESQFKVRTEYVEDNKLKVEKGRRTEQEKNKELLRIVMGITSLIKDIVALRKPIVGHNMFLDLMMFYKTFWAPLPKKYSSFKNEMMRIFPTMFDTKLLAFEMKKKVGKTVLNTAFNLKRLYDFFSEQGGKDLLPEMPIIVTKPHCPLVSTSVHDSGYDSYCTGYIYLQLAHMFSMWDDKKSTLTGFPIGNNPPCYFRATEPFKNRVNMIRGKLGHFNLAGPDPSEERPHFLLVETKNGRELDPQELTKVIAKFDSADLRLLSQTQMLIATACLKRLKLIEVAIANAGDYSVKLYEPQRKSRMKDTYLTIAALSMAGTLYLLLNKHK